MCFLCKEGEKDVDGTGWEVKRQGGGNSMGPMEGAHGTIRFWCHETIKRKEKRLYHRQGSFVDQDKNQFKD